MVKSPSFSRSSSSTSTICRPGGSLRGLPQLLQTEWVQWTSCANLPVRNLPKVKGTFNYTESAIFEQGWGAGEFDAMRKQRYNLLKQKGIPVPWGMPLLSQWDTIVTQALELGGRRGSSAHRRPVARRSCLLERFH